MFLWWFTRVKVSRLALSPGTSSEFCINMTSWLNTLLWIKLEHFVSFVWMLHFIFNSDLNLLDSCEGKLDCCSTAEGVTELPETQTGEETLDCSKSCSHRDKTRAQQVSGLVVFSDVVPPWQDYILHNILVCQPLLFSFHDPRGNCSCVVKIQEVVPSSVALLVWQTDNDFDWRIVRQIQHG